VRWQGASQSVSLSFAANASLNVTKDACPVDRLSVAGS